MDAAFAIDYDAGLATLVDHSYGAIVDVITAEMPSAWALRYERMCSGPTNLLVVPEHGFTYLFDYTSDPTGDVLAREDRLVAAFGRTQRADVARPTSRIAGFPGS